MEISELAFSVLIQAIAVFLTLIGYDYIKLKFLVKNYMSDFEVWERKISLVLHYPECWDTMAYPTVFDALREVGHSFQCTNEECESNHVWRDNGFDKAVNKMMEN